MTVLWEVNRVIEVVIAGVDGGEGDAAGVGEVAAGVGEVAVANVAIVGVVKVGAIIAVDVIDGDDVVTIAVVAVAVVMMAGRQEMVPVVLARSTPETDAGLPHVGGEKHGGEEHVRASNRLLTASIPQQSITVLDIYLFIELHL